YRRSTSMLPQPPSAPLFPYTTLFRSDRELRVSLGSDESIRIAQEIGEAIARPSTSVFECSRAERDPASGIRRLDEERLQAFEKRDRKSTRLNSSHEWISYAVFCLKKK